MSFLDAAGLKGTYDFVNLPMNVKRRANLGYVFVNFVRPEFVELCRSLLDGKPLGEPLTQKRCEVTLARVQVSIGERSNTPLGGAFVVQDEAAHAGKCVQREVACWYSL